MSSSLKHPGSKLDILRKASPYICYCTVENEQWIVRLTDGTSVWKSSDSLINDLKITMKELRDYLQDGSIVNVSVTSSSSLLLVLSSGGRKIDIELNKLPANDNREELKSLVFKLFDRITLLEEDLKDTKIQLEEAKKSTHRGLYVPPSSTDLGGISSTSSGRTNKLLKPAGHSLINPSTKKRKAASGVVFGDDDD
ncbi:PREDICTED: uncharacterized protein LOC109580761 [Amphimedon queenslandica]|uniref:Uncharacterized protein n=1 Tax=Amphimedon queenslandica TaxID=400682 RepID=A0A1X7VAM5_AMPQE|nr:PREDICTED: uncharacterized protein LOC109580761 [Amphimedon queenslandica]|eukprot:XP_019849829.1 PREDICTED: uncharacterized protein LOC109580761 [Amphimedon queenslandica]